MLTTVFLMIRTGSISRSKTHILRKRRQVKRAGPPLVLLACVFEEYVFLIERWILFGSSKTPLSACLFWVACITPTRGWLDRHIHGEISYVAHTGWHLSRDICRACR